MSKANKKSGDRGWQAWLVLLGLSALALLIWHFISGKNIAMFNPQGLIAQEQNSLLVITMLILVGVAVPVILFLYFIAWKYRESNTKAVHNPNPHHGKFLVFTMWTFPMIFFVIFMFIMIPATHKLEPRKSIASATKPLTIQVISMRWKWLFLYPDQKIASVNFVQLPKNTPVTFELTADEAPMSSFWIPNLGGQLYSMTGHVNRLNLLAEKTGKFRGSSAEINGSGFSEMLFTASVGSSKDFDEWVQDTQQNNAILDTTTYANLVKPSEHNPAAFYGSYQNDLYDTVVSKYMGHMHTTSQPASEGSE